MKTQTLTREDLAKKIRDELKLKPKAAKDIVNGFFEEMSQALIDGEDIKISGFGNFILKDKKERIGRNLHEQKEVKIPARRVVVFKPSNKLRDLVQKDYRQIKSDTSNVE